MNWYIKVLKNYVNFQGRARRAEYWFFVLFNLLIAILLAVVAKFASALTILLPIYDLAILLPSIAVGVRRLHDTGRSGFWLFIALVPLIGAIVLLVFFVLPGDGGSNKYGAVPSTSA